LPIDGSQARDFLEEFSPGGSFVILRSVTVCSPFSVWFLVASASVLSTQLQFYGMSNGVAQMVSDIKNALRGGQIDVQQSKLDINNGLEIQFSYCAVDIKRPWIVADLLNLSN
jgi:hypothetical protein